MLKELTDEKAFEKHNINIKFFEAERVYRIIKKYQIPCVNLTKENIFSLVLTYDKIFLKNEIPVYEICEEKQMSQQYTTKAPELVIEQSIH